MLISDQEWEFRKNRLADAKRLLRTRTVSNRLLGMLFLACPELKRPIRGMFLRTPRASFEAVKRLMQDVAGVVLTRTNNLDMLADTSPQARELQNAIRDAGVRYLSDI